MKFFFFLSIAFLITSCNNDNKTVTVTDKETGGTTTINANVSEQMAEAFNSKLEALQKLKPYTNEEMKTFVPATISGVAGSNIQVTNLMGTSYASGDYDINDSTTISLKIFDCGGEAGAGIYGIQFVAALNTQHEDEDEWTRSVDFNGDKAIEHSKKDDSEATFMWIAKERLMVSIGGNNISVEELKKIAGELSF